MRPWGSAANSSSSARCTVVPLIAGIDGGSGSLSIAEKRKARAQSLKVETFDGDSEVGSGRAMSRCYDPAVTLERMDVAMPAGSSSGPK